MRQNIKKIIPLVIIFAVLTGLYSFWPVHAAEKEPQKVKVAFPESPGLSATHEDGSRDGVFYDWLMEIAKYTGWEYEFIEGDVSDLLKQLEEGKVDIMCGMYYLPAMEEIYNYPKYSTGYTNSLLIKRSDDISVQNFDLSTLKGKTIGVFQNAVNKIEQLEYFLTYHNLTCELRYFKDPDKMGLALDQGEIDLLMGGDSYLTSGRTVAAQFGGEPYYIVTPKDAVELYAQLDEAITNIYMANSNFGEEIHLKYFPAFYDNTLVLTKEDKEFIKNAPPVRVALMKDRYPLSYMRGDEYQGICQDIFALIAEQTGLEFEFIYTDNYENMLNLVSDGKADIAGFFMDQECTAQKRGLMLTKNYASLDDVILKNKKSDYPSDELVLAVVEGRSIPAGSEPKEIRYFKTAEDCVNAVENGRADVTFVTSSFVEDLFSRNYYTQVTIIVSNTTQSRISVALPKNVNIPLFSILNKVINSIPEGEMNSIISRNLVSAGKNNMTIKSLVYANPLMFVTILGIFLFLAALCLLLYSRFRMESKVMQIQLEKATEASHAKSEFLSQMSHEIRTPMNAIIGLTQIAMKSQEVSSTLNNQLEEIQSSSQFLLSLVNDILDMAKIESSKMKLNPSPFRLRELMEQAESMIRVLAEKKQIEITFQCGLQNEYFIGDMLRIKQVVINLLSNALKFTEPGGRILLGLSELQNNKNQAELLFRVKDNGIGIEKKDLDLIFQAFEQVSDINKIGQGTGLGLTISSNLVRLMGGKLSVESVPGQGAEFFFKIWLPLSQPFEEKEDTLKQYKHNIKGMRILLAEDNDLNARIVTFMLEEEGAQVDWAVDGQMVVDMFQEQPEDYYNLVLMDIQMPVKSGLAAAEEIRSMNRSDAVTVPIVAMTANTFREDRNKAMEAGMNGFIPKPFQMEQFFEIVEHHISDEKE